MTFARHGEGLQIRRALVDVDTDGAHSYSGLAFLHPTLRFALTWSEVLPHVDGGGSTCLYLGGTLSLANWAQVCCRLACLEGTLLSAVRAIYSWSHL